MSTPPILRAEQVLEAGPAVVGHKAYALAQLATFAGTPAPMVLDAGWHHRFREAGEPALEGLGTALRKAGAAERLALRSSAVVRQGNRVLTEDTPGFLMAGWFESALAVPRADAAAGAAICYRGAESERVSALLHQAFGGSPATVTLPLIVQEFLPGARSAVLYTESPFAGAPPGSALIAATWGACQALVSGSETGDTYVVTPAGDLRARIHPKRRRWDPRDGHGGLAEGTVDSALVNVPCLDDGDVHQLVELGRRLAERFGSPQVVELVDAGGRGWIPVQSRAVQ